MSGSLPSLWLLLPFNNLSCLFLGTLPSSPTQMFEAQLISIVRTVKPSRPFLPLQDISDYRGRTLRSMLHSDVGQVKSTYLGPTYVAFFHLIPGPLSNLIFNEFSTQHS